MSYICKENFENKYVKDKKYCKVRDHCHYTGSLSLCTYAHSMGNLKQSVLKKILIAFHNGSNCDYHFIVKE